MCFVTDCQMGSLLGSKTLGTKCIRTSICNVLANHDQNIESWFRLAQSVFICKIGIKWLQDLFFCKISNLAQARLTCRLLCFTPSIKIKTLATFYMSLICYVLNLVWDLKVFTFIHTQGYQDQDSHQELGDRFSCYIKNLKKIWNLWVESQSHKWEYLWL